VAEHSPSANGVEVINAGRLKHLEMIQAIITRMAGNSFLVKGWSITLIAAILAIAVKDKVYAMVWVAFLPTLMFWLLDVFFLRQERLYRKLWDAKRMEPQVAPTDFSLDTTAVATGVSSWVGTAFSHTLIIFHGGLALILVVIVALLRIGYVA